MMLNRVLDEENLKRFKRHGRTTEKQLSLLGIRVLFLNDNCRYFVKRKTINTISTMASALFLFFKDNLDNLNNLGIRA